MNTTTAPPNPPTTATPQAHASVRRTRSLGRYRAHNTDQEREVLRVQRPDGSALVVDYKFGTLSDGRLIAHLSPDEPVENARIISDLYLADDERRGRCRALAPEDFQATRHATPSPSNGHGSRLASHLQDAAGHVYRISKLNSERSGPELRWTRSHHPGREDSFDAVTLRDVVGNLEAYEPAQTLTREALARTGECVSTTRLRNEAQRLTASAIVLNRGLREAVQRELRLGVMTLSDIAVRCGRVRRDHPSGRAGEASWVARRIGTMPAGGEERPCPWVHIDVLALIARDGLGISPREVEL